MINIAFFAQADASENLTILFRSPLLTEHGQQWTEAFGCSLSASVLTQWFSELPRLAEIRPTPIPTSEPIFTMLPLLQVQSSQCQSKLALWVVFCGTVSPYTDLKRARIYYLGIMAIRGLRWPQMVLQRCIRTLEGSFLESPYMNPFIYSFWDSQRSLGLFLHFLS